MADDTTCCVCGGSGLLIDSTCPLCDGDANFCQSVDEGKRERGWEIQLGGWVRYDNDTEKLFKEARATGRSTVEYCARGQCYCVDLDALVQVNLRTGVRRVIREIEIDSPRDDIAEELPPRSARFTRLVDRLLSPAVQVQLPVNATEEPEQLSAKEVEQVFIDNVPGVQEFLYRDMEGEFALQFLVVAYKSGLRAFVGTPLHSHLLWLLRTIVHNGHAKKEGAPRRLREVAEAFMDCQAVQARIIERVGLELRGISCDFWGQVLRLAGNYKTLALKMLASERIRKGLASDDGNPTHYENRLAADIGDAIGLNKEDVRLASLDVHAQQRFPRFRSEEILDAAARCRNLFDLEAFIKALTVETNALNADSSTESLPRQFVEWASVGLRDPHIIFDEAEGLTLRVGEPLVLAIVEVLVLGSCGAPREETYQGVSLCDLVTPLPPDTGDHDWEVESSAATALP